MTRIRSHQDWEVYDLAFKNAMEIFDLTRSFPKEEKYSLTDQIRRSSRSVCANLAEAFRKRRYEGYFISKLSDCEMEAAETQVWIAFANQCGYISTEKSEKLTQQYHFILGKLVNMARNADHWTI